MEHRPGNLRSTKPTNLPAGPPILFKVLPTPLAAPAMAGPAALDTLLSPWLALLADSLAASVAFSVEVDWKRRVARRRVGERRARRAADMMGEGVCFVRRFRRTAGMNVAEAEVVMAVGGFVVDGRTYGLD